MECPCIVFDLTHGLEPRNGNEPLGVCPQPAQRRLCHCASIARQHFSQCVEFCQQSGLLSLPEIPVSANIVLRQFRVDVEFPSQQTSCQWTANDPGKVILV